MKNKFIFAGVLLVLIGLFFYFQLPQKHKSKVCAVFKDKMPRRLKEWSEYAICDFSANCPSAYIVAARNDRYGSNATCWVAAMLIAEINRVPLYHHCERQCINGQLIKDKIYHQILSDYCKKGHPPKHSRVIDIESDGEWWPIRTMYACRQLIGSDIPTGVRKMGLASKWFKYFDRQAKELDWKLRWDPTKSIVIHVRLEDVRPKPDTRTNFFHQTYIGNQRLQSLVKHLHQEFPTHEIHIVTAPHENDIQRCKDSLKEFSFVKGVWGDEDEDYALWQMMCSDVLILSRSTFGFLAGFLHQGQHCWTYENWLNFETLIGPENQGTWKILPASMSS